MLAGKITIKTQLILAVTVPCLALLLVGAASLRSMGNIKQQADEFNIQLGLGVGLYYQSRQFASISNATVLPAYTRIDAALFYKLTDKIEAQLNVENLTGKAYFPVAHNDNNISTGAPINGRFTLAAKF